MKKIVVVLMLTLVGNAYCMKAEYKQDEPALIVQQQRFKELDQEVRQYCILRNGLMKRNLDLFFSDLYAQALAALPRELRLQPHWGPRMKPAVQRGLALYQKQIAIIRAMRGCALIEAQKHFNFKILSSRHAYILHSKELWPGYLLKMPAINYPSYPAICGNQVIPSKILTAETWRDIETCVSPRQCVSRAYAAHEMRKFIEENHLKHVCAPKKYLYKLPWAISDEINDNNYVVVSKEIEHIFPSQEILQSPNFQSSELCDEIMRVIEHCGVWSVNGTLTPNIQFFIGEDGQLHAAFIDLEKPGLGGSEDPSFFHQNAEEVANNAACGMKEFIDLCSLPE